MIFLKKPLESLLKRKTTNSNPTLGIGSMIIMCIGAVIGTGVFATTGFVAAKYTGPAVILSFAFAGTICLLVAIIYSELATALPTSGAIYSYSYVTSGEMFAWLSAGIMLCEFGFAAGGISGCCAEILSPIFIKIFDMIPISIDIFQDCNINFLALFLVLISGITLLNDGSKSSKGELIANLLSLFKIIAIALFFIIGIPNINIAHLAQDFMPHGLQNIFIGTSLLIFSYGGITMVFVAADDCKNPKRDVLWGIILSIILITVIYIFMSGVLVSLVPYYELDNAAPFVYALEKTASPMFIWMVPIIDNLILIGMVAALIFNIKSCIRVAKVVAVDGLFPRFIAKIDPKNHTIENSTGLLIFAIIFIGILSAFIDWQLLIKMQVIFALTHFLVAIVLVVYFRVKHPEIERKILCPMLYVLAPIAFALTLYGIYTLSFENGSITIQLLLVMASFLLMLVLYFIRLVMQKFQSGEAIR